MNTTKKTGGAVKRPMNAFLIFCKRHRSLVRDKYPHLDNRAVTRILGELWAKLPSSEKGSYTNLACKYKEAFLKANPDYKWFNPSKSSSPTRLRPSTRPSNSLTSYRGQVPHTDESNDVTASNSDSLMSCDEASLHLLSSMALENIKTENSKQESCVDNNQTALENPPVISDPCKSPWPSFTGTESARMEGEEKMTPGRVADAESVSESKRVEGNGIVTSAVQNMARLQLDAPGSSLTLKTIMASAVDSAIRSEMLAAEIENSSQTQTNGHQTSSSRGDTAENNNISAMDDNLASLNNATECCKVEKCLKPNACNITELLNMNEMSLKNSPSESPSGADLAAEKSPSSSDQPGLNLGEMSIQSLGDLPTYHSTPVGRLVMEGIIESMFHRSSSLEKSLSHTAVDRPVDPVKPAVSLESASPDDSSSSSRKPACADSQNSECHLEATKTRSNLPCKKKWLQELNSSNTKNNQMSPGCQSGGNGKRSQEHATTIGQIQESLLQEVVQRSIVPSQNSSGVDPDNSKALVAIESELKTMDVGSNGYNGTHLKQEMSSVEEQNRLTWMPDNTLKAEKMFFKHPLQSWATRNDPAMPPGGLLKTTASSSNPSGVVPPTGVPFKAGCTGSNPVAGMIEAPGNKKAFSMVYHQSHSVEPIQELECEEAVNEDTSREIPSKREEYNIQPPKSGHHSEKCSPRSHATFDGVELTELHDHGSASVTSASLSELNSEEISNSSDDFFNQPMRKRVYSDTDCFKPNSSGRKRYKTGDFDLDAQIASLPAVQIDDIGYAGSKNRNQTRGRHHSDSSVLARRQAAKHGTFLNPAQLRQLLPQEAIPLLPTDGSPLGSRKRKVRDRAITRLIPSYNSTVKE